MILHIKKPCIDANSYKFNVIKIVDVVQPQWLQV